MSEARTPTPPHAGTARRAIAGAGGIAFAIVWTHGLGAVLQHVGAGPTPVPALAVTLTAAVVAVVGLVSQSRLTTLGTGLAAWGAMTWYGVGAFAAALAIAPPLAVGTALACASRLPSAMDAIPRKHPFVAALWLIVTVLALVQLGRVATWVTDPSFDWYGTTRHPFWAKHECLNAYTYGAELTERGDPNPWRAEHYPGLNPNAQPETRLFDHPVEDPYQYTPQFLLLPRAAIALTDHYPTIRGVWFGLQTTGFLLLAAWLAIWVGGREGHTALAALPLALVAVPTLHNFQYGQVHLTAVALGIGGLLAFDRGWRVAGGTLLAVSVLSKIFPIVLVVPLVAQRRWKDLTAVAAAGVLITAVAVGVLGAPVFQSFFEYHLPRVGSAEAFAFGEAWPEVRELVIAANHGAYGFVTKLGEMGVRGADASMAVRVGRGFFLSVLVLGFVVGLKLQGADRYDRATAWLALAILGSMGSAGAFADYVPSVAAWLATFMVLRLRDGIVQGGFLAIAWVFQASLLGAAPWGGWAAPEWTMPLSAVSVLLLVALCSYAIARAAMSVASPAVKSTAPAGRPIDSFS